MPIPPNAAPPNKGWLDIDAAALVPGEMRGWRAADFATQTIRLVFDQPQRLTRLALVFEETETDRTQECRASGS